MKLNNSLQLLAAQKIRYIVNSKEPFLVGCVPVERWEFEKGTVGNKGSSWAVLGASTKKLGKQAHLHVQEHIPASSLTSHKRDNSCFLFVVLFFKLASHGKAVKTFIIFTCFRTKERVQP